MRLDMNEYVALVGFLSILMIQGILLWKCLAIEHAMVTESGAVQTGLGNVGNLLDEGLDLASEFFDGQKKANPAIQAMSASIPEFILSTLMSRMQMPDHGSEAQRQISEEKNDPQTEEISEPD